MRSASRTSAVRLWIGPGAVWLALAALLAVTVGSAYVPLGPFNSVVNLIIAAIKAALIAVFFMNLKDFEPVTAARITGRVFSARLHVFADRRGLPVAPLTQPLWGTFGAFVSLPKDNVVAAEAGDGRQDW